MTIFKYKIKIYTIFYQSPDHWPCLTLHGWPKDRFVHDAILGGIVGKLDSLSASAWLWSQTGSESHSPVGTGILHRCPPAPTLFTCYSACVALLSFQLILFNFILFCMEAIVTNEKPPVLQYRREMQKVPEASCLTPSAAISCDAANFILHHVAWVLDGAFFSFFKYNIFLQSCLPCVCFP